MGYEGSKDMGLESLNMTVANLKIHFSSATDVVIGKARRNALAIERGWEELDTLFTESLAPPFKLTT